MLDGDEGADADFGEAFDGLDDDFDGFALFLGGVEKGMGAEFGEDFAEFGLENNEDGDGGEGDKGAEEPAEDFEVEDEGKGGEGEEQEDKAIDDGRAAGPADELETEVEADRENGNLQDGPPAIVYDVNYVRHDRAAPSVIPSGAPPDASPGRRGTG